MLACTYAALSVPGGGEGVPADTRFLRLPAAQRRALVARGRLADGDDNGCEGCARCWAALRCQRSTVFTQWLLATHAALYYTWQRRRSSLQSRAHLP